MVGEIRDVETAKISIEAALTGHFVLSSLHTNDAPSADAPERDGREPFLTGSPAAVLAQRLVRKLCTHCCELYMPTEQELAGARFAIETSPRPGWASTASAAARRCNQTGYKGRIGVFQLMVMSEMLSRLASQHSSREELERAPWRAGWEACGTTASPRSPPASRPSKARPGRCQAVGRANRPPLYIFKRSSSAD